IKLSVKKRKIQTSQQKQTTNENLSVNHQKCFHQNSTHTNQQKASQCRHQKNLATQHQTKHTIEFSKNRHTSTFIREDFRRGNLSNLPLLGLRAKLALGESNRFFP
ncbi:hypothetical protein, partial [Spelaeicoccus albus]